MMETAKQQSKPSHSQECQDALCQDQSASFHNQTPFLDLKEKYIYEHNQVISVIKNATIMEFTSYFINRYIRRLT